MLKFISPKNVRQYIDDDNMPAFWGGKDDYVYSFVPEKRQTDGAGATQNGTAHHHNNNSDEQANLNLMQRKVSDDMENLRL